MGDISGRGKLGIDMREIWTMQPRFEKRTGSAPYSMLEQPRFRAGFDFLRLRADAWGDPAAPAVLLLHGGGQTRHAWGGTAAALARDGGDGADRIDRGRGGGAPGHRGGVGGIRRARRRSRSRWTSGGGAHR